MWNIITKNVANFGVELGPGNFLYKHVDLLFKGRLCGMYSSWVKTFLVWLKAEAYKAPSDIVVQISLRKLIKDHFTGHFPRSYCLGHNKSSSWPNKCAARYGK